jgi:hypothetical protein
MSPNIIYPLPADQLDLVFVRSANYDLWELANFCQTGKDYFHPSRFKTNAFSYSFQPEFLRVGLGPTVRGLTPRQLSNAVNLLDANYISDHFQKSILDPSLPHGTFILEYAIPDLPLERDAYASRSILLTNKIKADITHGMRKERNPFRFRHLSDAHDRFEHTDQGYYLYDSTRRVFLDGPLPSRNHIAIPAKALARMGDDEKHTFIESLATFNAVNTFRNPYNYLTNRKSLIIDANGHPLRVLDSFPKTERQAFKYFAVPEAWTTFKPLWQNPWTKDEALTATARPSAISKKVFGPPAPSPGNADTTPTTSTGSTPTSTRRKPKLGGVGNIHRLLSRNPAGAFHRLKQMGILGSPQEDAKTSDTSSAPLPPSNTTNKPTP